MSYEDERKFLHDLSNPLSVVHGNLKIALRKIEAIKELSPQHAEIIERLTKASDACDRMVKSISDRRDKVIEQQNSKAS